jgi:hypothetical protein
MPTDQKQLDSLRGPNNDTIPIKARAAQAQRKLRPSAVTRLFDTPGFTLKSAGSDSQVVSLIYVCLCELQSAVALSEMSLRHQPPAHLILLTAS